MAAPLVQNDTPLIYDKAATRADGASVADIASGKTGETDATDTAEGGPDAAASDGGSPSGDAAE